MSKKKYPKPIIKLCPNCMELVAIVWDGNSGLCPRCKTKLYDKTAGGIGKIKELHFKRITRRK